VGILGSSIISVDFPKSDELYSLSGKNTGLILLSSHVGTWKIVMAHMNYLAKPVSFLLKTDKNEHNRYFFDISGSKSQYKLIDPTGFMGGMIESASVLENKECLAVNGDRAFNRHTGEAVFFGQKAVFPVIAQNLAYSTDSALVMLLTSRTGKLSYNIEYINLTEKLPACSGRTKSETIQEYLNLYAENLESFLQKNPYMWFNFFDFWYKD
jgi:predicted LPLAT superfamily acyltransferase